MKIGLIDVDGHNYPNLPLMKLSAWHKQNGDSVEWYIPVIHGFPLPPMDKVYMSKVFSFTPDYQDFVNAKEVIKGGSGYCISLVDGKEVYNKEKDSCLPDEIEHIYPDYSLYGITDTAYGSCPGVARAGVSFATWQQKKENVLTRWRICRNSGTVKRILFCAILTS